STAPTLLELPPPQLDESVARALPVALPRDRTAWALGLVLAAGVLLRVWQIDAIGLNSDEAVYVGQSAGIGHVQGLEPYFPIFRFAMSQRPMWLYGAGAALGLTVLAKETGIVLVGAIYAFFALSPAVSVRIRDLAKSMGVLALVVAPYPLALMLSGESGTG